MSWKSVGRRAAVPDVHKIIINIEINVPYRPTTLGRQRNASALPWYSPLLFDYCRSSFRTKSGTAEWDRRRRIGWAVEKARVTWHSIKIYVDSCFRLGMTSVVCMKNSRNWLDLASPFLWDANTRFRRPTSSLRALPQPSQTYMDGPTQRYPLGNNSSESRARRSMILIRKCTEVGAIMHLEFKANREKMMESHSSLNHRLHHTSTL